MNKNISFTLTMDSNGEYSVSNYKEVEQEPEHRSHLHLYLECAEPSYNLADRLSAVQYVFRHKFHDALTLESSTFRENKYVYKMIVKNASNDQVIWANIAKECGLIDDFMHVG